MSSKETRLQPASADDRKPLDAADALSIEFADLELLRLALVHRSFLNELGMDSDDDAPESNERLEFLGDAILGMITAEFLYHRFPDLPEGNLTAFRTALVRTETLANWARQFGLDQHLYLGRGELLNEGEVRDRILAGAFEAVIAALYLDQGLEKTRQFLRRLLEHDAAEIISAGQETNYKGRLQELIQERERITPEYRTVDVTGPAHERQFAVEVLVRDQRLGTGSGSSKRAAQQDAARNALIRLAEEEDGATDEQAV